ncbi:MAG: hypothetical protein ABL949_10880 [Fimbriimonadaceae bacterium]
MEILKLLDELKEAAVDRPHTFIGLTIGLDKDEILNKISKVRAALPTEVKQAQQTVRESDRIVESAREDATNTLDAARREAERLISDARQEADKVLAHAQAQQDRMTHESEILKLAKAQSEEVRSLAERDSIQVRRGAESYALDVLNQLETVVGRLMTAIERGKSEIQPRDDRPVVPTVRDKR